MSDPPLILAYLTLTAIEFIIRKSEAIRSNYSDFTQPNPGSIYFWEFTDLSIIFWACS